MTKEEEDEKMEIIRKLAVEIYEDKELLQIHEVYSIAAWFIFSYISNYEL